MDLSLMATSPGVVSKNAKKRRRKQAAKKRKAMENNGPQVMDQMDDNFEVSDKITEHKVAYCTQEKNLDEKDLNNQAVVEDPKIATENSFEGNKCGRKKRGKVTKNTAAESVVDVQTMESMDESQMVSESTENVAVANITKKRKRRAKKKKGKNKQEVKGVDQVDATLNLHLSKENHVEEIACTLTENFKDNPTDLPELEEAVVLSDTTVVSSNRISSETGEISVELEGKIDRSSPKPNQTAQEDEKFEDRLNEGNNEIVVNQAKSSAEDQGLLSTCNDEMATHLSSDIKEGECLSEELVRYPIAAAITSNRRKLLVLDVNGLLANIVMPAPKDRRGDVHIYGRAIFRRPFCDEFLEFCFQNFDVGVWSSRSKRIIDRVVDYLLGNHRDKLLFCWDMEHSTQTGYRTLENCHKPLVCKELRRIWENDDPKLPWKKGDYDESNTLLLDDSPYKALLNPLNTAIFPKSYHYEDENDNSLGPGGDLRVYLEGLLKCENVQKYVEQNPFGQGAINETDSSWAFYSEVLQTISNRPEDNTPLSIPTLN